MKLVLEKSHVDKIEIELEIMNSNPEYNLLSEGKEVLAYEDILPEHQSDLPGKDRYLVKYGNKYVAILDFCMLNPNDGKPWLGLLAVHKNSQKIGVGRQVYQIYEDMMRERGVEIVRIGVLNDNIGALRFWTKLGFVKYTEKEYKGKAISCFEKMIN